MYKRQGLILKKVSRKSKDYVPQHPTAAHSVCRKNYIVDKNGVAGAEPPTGTRGGSPTLSPGMDAGRVCTRALQDAKPTKHTQPFTTGKGFGVRVREFALFYKNRLFLQPEEEIPRLFSFSLLTNRLYQYILYI